MAIRRRLLSSLPQSRMVSRCRSLLPAVLLAASVTGGDLLAQQPGPASSDAMVECTYDLCALNIAPRWNGLAVVRASDGPQVANLNFFLPRDITSSLRGPSAGSMNVARPSTMP